MFHMNPEFRSITAICIVEDLSKCPMGYTPISKTSDTDKLDADLWKDGFFTVRKVTRYVCISKSQGRPEHVISGIQILHDKDLPPEGHSLLQYTVDTNQKALQKKQISYKVAHFRTNVESIVDLILLSRPKPPENYENIGEINGFHLCVRKISAITRLQSPSLSYGVLPGARPPMYPQLHDNINELNLSGNGNENGQIASPHMPNYMTTSNNAANSPYPNYPTATISSLSGLEGVPFILHEALTGAPGGNMNRSIFHPGSQINLKSLQDLDREYSYDFRTEREVLYEI